MNTVQRPQPHGLSRQPADSRSALVEAEQLVDASLAGMRFDNGHVDTAFETASDIRTELAATIRNRFEATGYRQLASLGISVDNGHVQLTGRLPAWYLLQVAQRAAMDIPGVDALTSHVQVARSARD